MSVKWTHESVMEELEGEMAKARVVMEFATRLHCAERC